MRSQGCFAGGYSWQSSQRKVFLKMSKLVMKTANDINGPVMNSWTTVGDTGLKTVSVSFDATRFPFQIKHGVSENHVCFAGKQSLNVIDADLDAVSKVCAYLTSKFSIRFADWSYDKLHTVETKISEVENSIKHHVININDMIDHWKASVELLTKTQLQFSSSANPLQICVSEELSTVNYETQTFLEDISNQMQSLNAENVQCLVNDNHCLEDPIILKISERDIIDDILDSLGLNKAKFSNTVQDNCMFRGSCMINVNCTSGARSTGKTVVHGEPKKSAYEAECNAAANAISFLQGALGIEVVDLSYFGLIDKQQFLNSLISLKAKYEKIEHEVPVEWRSKIFKIKTLVEDKYEVCKESNFDVDESSMIDTAQIIDGTVADMTMFYDLCTIDLDHDGSFI